MTDNLTLFTSIISGVLSFIAGGGLIAWLKFYKDKRTDDRSFAEQERDDMKAEIERLKSLITAMSAQIVPSNFPVWIKDAEGKYVYVNQAWEMQIGTRIKKFKSQVIGYTDIEVFEDSPDFIKIMQSINKQASESGGITVMDNVRFPNRIGIKIVVKEIVIRELENMPILRGFAIPTGTNK